MKYEEIPLTINLHVLLINYSNQHLTNITWFVEQNNRSSFKVYIVLFSLSL